MRHSRSSGERHRRGFRAPARCRSETGAPGRPSRLICWGYVPRRSYPDGWGMRRRGPAGRCADRRSAFQAVPALLRDWRWEFRGLAGRCAGPHWEDCPEVGAPGRPGACSRSVLRGTHVGRMERHRRGFRAPARCRSEDRRSWLRGTHGGGRERYRSWFRAPARCRSEDRRSWLARHSRWREGASSEQVSRSRAMPV